MKFPNISFIINKMLESLLKEINDIDVKFKEKFVQEEQNDKE